MSGETKDEGYEAVKAKMEVVHKALQDSDKNLTKMISERDEELEATGKVARETKERVAKAEEMVLSTKKELDGIIAEVVKKADGAIAEQVDLKRRMADFEKRYGRIVPGGEGAIEVKKSIGTQYVEAITSAAYADERAAMRLGKSGGLRVRFEGRQFTDGARALHVMKAMGIPFSLESYEEVRKTTVTLGAATNLVQPFRDTMVEPLRRPLSIRALMPSQSIASAEFHYIEYQGMGPHDGVAISSLVSSGYFATATIADSSALREGDLVEIEGVVEAGYDGVWPIVEIADGTHFKVQLDNDPASDTTTGTITYRLMSRYGAAVAVAEAGDKAQARMKFIERTGKIATIANWIPATRQVLDDMAELEAMINDDLVASVDEKFDVDLLYGTGTGINGDDVLGILKHPMRQTLSQGSMTILNAIRRQRTYLELANMVGTGLVVNPKDHETIETQTGNDGHYILVGGVNGSTSGVWRVPIVSTPVIRPKTILMGAWDRGGKVYDRQQTDIRFSDSHASFFTTNLLAILGEARMGLAIRRPRAFVELTLG